jgi:resolvase-like protein
MPPSNCDPHSRRPSEDPQAQRVVRVAVYQRLPILGESDFLQSYVDSQPDWHAVLRCSDDGSGATLKRPGLQRVLGAARSGAIDVLVVNHMYNLSRTTQHLAFLLDELTSRGVRVVSAADPGLDTKTPFGLFLVRVVSAVAEIEYTGARADRRDRLRHKQESVDESPLAG